MTTARIAPQWAAPSSRRIDRSVVALAAGVTWLLLLLLGLALFLI